jgi:hypothetical protein
MHHKHSQVHRWRRLLPVLGPLMAVAFTLLLALPVSAATTTTTTTIISPVDFVVSDPCTNQLIPTCVLIAISKVRKVGHRTQLVGGSFQLDEFFAQFVNHLLE